MTAYFCTQHVIEEETQVSNNQHLRFKQEVYIVKPQLPFLLYHVIFERRTKDMSVHFKPYEFRCSCHRHDGEGDPIMHPRLYEVLENIRAEVGVPIYITSGYRCEEHNREVGGVPNSQHVQCTAADITYDGIDVDYLASVAERAGADGIGSYYYQDFVHVDVRGYPARWDDQD